MTRMMNQQRTIRQFSHCLYGNNHQNVIRKFSLSLSNASLTSSLSCHHRPSFGTSSLLLWTSPERARLSSIRASVLKSYFHWSSSNKKCISRGTRSLSSCTTLLLQSPSTLIASSNATRTSRSIISIQKQDFHSSLPSYNNNDDSKTDDKSSSSGAAAPHSDPPILTWYDPYTPEWMGPYFRLARVDKPIGTWLLLWPCLWSTAMASPYTLPDPYLCTLFAVGSAVMRGSGCTINDLWDQDFDKQVKRTQTRPLASGELTTRQAIPFLGLQLLTGLGVLVNLPHLEYCFLWGVSSLPLVVVYPLMKRITNFPQVFLGLTFNWGAWMGWAATYGSMNYAVIAPLYFSGVCWTVVYDTIYANQDKDDDKAIGLKSTALTFGEDETKHKQILHGFAALTFVQWLAAGYMMEDISMIPYSLGMSAAYSHLLWQIQTAELDNPQNLADRFRSNTVVGGIVFASIVAGKVL